MILLLMGLNTIVTDGFLFDVSLVDESFLLQMYFRAMPPHCSFTSAYSNIVKYHTWPYEWLVMETNGEYWLLFEDTP